MEQFPLLRDIVVLMVVSVPISIILTRVGLPTILGFLLTGMIIGPYGLGLITEMETVQVFSQIGIVLLLFTIGLEFSITRMLHIRREGIIGGGLQVGLTTLAVFAVGLVLGFPLSTSLLLGFIISLSSTAIVLKLFMDRGEVNTPHGNFSLGVLLFQDIAVVLMVLVVQIMGQSASFSVFEIAKILGLSFIAVIVIVAAVIFIIPKIFDHVVKLRNREVFVLTTLLVCIGTAWMTSLFGLSLAMGAFIAGLAVSESEYSNQVVADVIPFRDTFSSLFFISIGMLLDFRFFADNILWVLVLVVAIMGVKIIIITGVGALLRYPMRLSLTVGLNLAQIGEFSFILIGMGDEYRLLPQAVYQSLLAASIASMAVTPFIFPFSSKAAFEAAHLMGLRTARKETKKPVPSNHVIIVGYGLNGQNLAKVLKETGIACVVVDFNMDRVRKAKEAGHHAIFGDASHHEILRKLGIEKAKMVVVAITDPVTTRRVVKTSRDLNRAVSIIVRTRYAREVEDLYKLGANQVIPEEFETSVEIFSRVLRDYRVPGNIVQNQIDIIRQEGYAMLRTPSITTERLAKLTQILEASVMDTFYMEAGCAATGKTIAELNMRKLTGATIIAVVRKGEARTNPGADFLIESGDILVLLGSHAELNSAFALLKEGCPLPDAGGG